jgi:hypothetical protein
MKMLSAIIYWLNYNQQYYFVLQFNENIAVFNLLILSNEYHHNRNLSTGIANYNQAGIIQVIF